MNLPAVDQLHNCTTLIEAGKAKASEGFLIIGSALALVMKERLWVGQFEGFEEYCTHINLSRSHAYKLANIWLRWGEKAKGIQVHRLSKMLVLKKEDDEELLEQARELNPGAFQAFLQEKQGKVPNDGDCKHFEVHSYCAVCRKRVG